MTQDSLQDFEQRRVILCCGINYWQQGKIRETNKNAPAVMQVVTAINEGKMLVASTGL